MPVKHSFLFAELKVRTWTKTVSQVTAFSSKTVFCARRFLLLGLGLEPSLLASKVPLPSLPGTSFRVVYSHVPIATSHGYFTVILQTVSLRIKVSWDSRMHLPCPTHDLPSQQLWERDPAVRVSQTLQVKGIPLTQRTTLSLPSRIQVTVSTGCAETTPPITLVFPVSGEYQCNSVQLLSHVRLFGTPWTAARQACLSITNSWSLLRLMYIQLVMPSSHLIICCSLLLLPSIFPSIGVFSSESVLHIRWPKYWSFSFSISPSNEYSRLISFRKDWLDLLAIQGIPGGQ